MAQTECANGHVYDSEIYASCPYCGGGANEISFNAASGATASVNGGYGSGSSDTIRTSLGRESAGDASGRTVAPDAYRRSNRTVAHFKKSTGIEPVVGWIVCIKGAEQGQSYNLYDKQNTIGRDEGNDVVIRGDDTISRENHARIAYDIRHNAFTLIAKESINNIYLNDEPVYAPTKLASYDLIEMGESQFLFVPLCCDRFIWTDVIKGKEQRG